MYLALRNCLEAWPDVQHKASLRAAPGTHGLFLGEADACGPAEAFLLGTEFAHFHPLPDGALHMTLPQHVRRAAMDAGWAIPHPLAGQPTVSPLTVLVYAPRTHDELDVVIALVRSAEAYARGQERQTTQQARKTEA